MSKLTRGTGQLSSRWTPFFKYLFPAGWIGGFGAGTLAVFRDPASVVHNGARGTPPPGIEWVFLGLWVLGSAFLLWLALPLKRVRVADGALWVSNYRREVRVPFGLVAEVRQNRWVNVRPVSVRLKADLAGLGDRFAFVPPARLRFAVWREDPEVAALRRLIGLRPGSGERAG